MRSAQRARVARPAPRARLWLICFSLCCLTAACKLERSPSDSFDADVPLDGDVDDGDDTMNNRNDADVPGGNGGSGGRNTAGKGGGGGSGGMTADNDAGPDTGMPMPPKNDEKCDGKDNDADDKVDEDLGTKTCGVGACAVTVAACKDGKAPECKPKAPAKKDVDTCNEIDDDCDGKVDESADEDKDGFSICDGDCCDKAGTCSTGTTPQLVNPGAFEVLNNAIDDDCDEATIDTAKPSCEPEPLETPTTAKKLAQAMELCRFTTEEPKSNERTWGVISSKFYAADHKTAAPADIQRGVLAQYGPSVLPQVGSAMAAISSGTARDATDPGFKTPEYDEQDSWKDGSQGAPPAEYLEAHDGMIGLPADAECDYSKANDSIAFEMHVRVPTNANSFSVRFKLFSAEYSEWICHDYFLALVTTGADGVPADQNIAVTGGVPVSLQNASYTMCQGEAAVCTGGATELTGTGMEAVGSAAESLGAGTPWFTMSSPVKPGEEMQLELMVWDAFDHYGDTVALIDGFEWSTVTAVAGATTP